MKLLSLRTGTSTIEYIIVLIVLLLAFSSAMFFFPRIMAGKWKSAVDTFGLGRQYDPEKSLDCAYYDTNGGFGVWYNAVMFKQRYPQYYKESCAKEDDFVNPYDCQAEAYSKAARASLCPACCTPEELSQSGINPCVRSSWPERYR